MAEDLHAQVVHDVLAHPLHDLGLVRSPAEARRPATREVEQRDLVEARAGRGGGSRGRSPPWSATGRAIWSPAAASTNTTATSDLHRGRGAGSRAAAASGAVVGAAERLFLVVGGVAHVRTASSSSSSCCWRYELGVDAAARRAARRACRARRSRRPSSTTIWSAWRTVRDAVRDEQRRAALHHLRQARAGSPPRCTCRRYDRQSSSSRTAASRSTARAIAVRCFCPPESVMPRSPTSVS